MILILIFAEVLGLYGMGVIHIAFSCNLGLIVALILNTQGSSGLECHADCYNPYCKAGECFTS